MEQIDYISEVDYRGRVQDFLAVSPKDLFARGMREINAAVTEAKARMNAYFNDRDLYMCLDVFNLDEWVHLLPLASSQSLRTTQDLDGIRLARHLRHGSYHDADGQDQGRAYSTAHSAWQEAERLQ